MEIEIGQRVALGDDWRATERVHEPAQRLLHLEDHARAARGDQRHIAAELDCIAQSLFAMKQDGLAGDRLARATAVG